MRMLSPGRETCLGRLPSASPAGRGQEQPGLVVAPRLLCMTLRRVLCRAQSLWPTVLALTCAPCPCSGPLRSGPVAPGAAAPASRPPHSSGRAHLILSGRAGPPVRPHESTSLLFSPSSWREATSSRRSGGSGLPTQGRVWPGGRPGGGSVALLGPGLRQSRRAGSRAQAHTRPSPVPGGA